MANFITICRIALSAVILFSKIFSPTFYICYLLAGFTDMIDGSVARKLGTANDFGQKLDTAADMIFVMAAAVKIFPILELSTGIIIWIALIALIKMVNIVSGIIIYRQFVSVHSIVNKVTGAILFVFPLIIAIIPIECSVTIICAVATFAAVQEGYLIITRQI